MPRHKRPRRDPRKQYRYYFRDKPNCTACRNTYQRPRYLFQAPSSPLQTPQISDRTSQSNPTASSDLISNLPLEVLVEILSLLDLTTLLLAQRVSRNWQAIISRTSSLQRALFFLPNPAPPPIAIDSSLIHASTSGLTSIPGDQPPAFFHGNPFNPLLARIFGLLFSSFSIDSQNLTTTLSFLPWATTPESRARVLRPQASWRHMLPAYGPAVRKLFVLPKDSLRGAEIVEMDFSDGWERSTGAPWMTMGAYYDIFLEGMSWDRDEWGTWALLSGVGFPRQDLPEPYSSRFGDLQRATCSIAGGFSYLAICLDKDPPNDENGGSDAVLLVDKWYIKQGALLTAVRKREWWCGSNETERKPKVRKAEWHNAGQLT